ncbi:MAG: CocE/NonD family hydrolase [Gammaproteobacteria bacterium]|nr:CocE/NonD family hydrolase [Gammaproteobacteria bacterium]
MMHQNFDADPKFHFRALVVCGILLAACGRPSVAADSAELFEQRGSVTAPQYRGYQRAAYYAPMADGVKLAVTLYTPTGGPAAQGFPVLLWYLPGHRESIDPATGRVTSVYSEHDLQYFTSRGYALAVAEMRGSGASFGARELDRGPQIGRDGKQLVDWIAAQPFSNGKVGMVGASYQGFSQYATAAEAPAALKAIFPEIAGFDDYTSMFYPGGIGNIALSAFASASIIRDDQNFYEPAGPRARLPAAPVMDEDGDGELADEIPIDKDGDGSFLNDGEPTYRDGQPRQHVYFNATRDHLANANLTLEALARAPYRDSKVNGTAYTFEDIDPSDRPRRIAQAGIAVYHRGGWFDYHARDTVMWHATLAGHAPSHLMMAPTGHGSFPADDAEALYRAGPYFKYFGDTATHTTLLNEKLRFFDHYLRGIDNGYEQLPPVLLYVMGSGWRTEQAWPLARQVMTEYHFAEQGQLTTGPANPGSDEFTVAMDADSRSQGANRWNYGTSGAREPLQLAGDAAARLRYTSTPVNEDTEVTGHPIVEIHLSANVANADVYVYLEDVTPDGKALLVTEGQLRANYAGVLPVQQMLKKPAGEIVVKPELPWHGYRAQDYVANVLENGRTVALQIDLMPTAWVFKAGHRIRVSIAGADAPSFTPHPALAQTTITPTWTIHRGPSLSRITLPVIPQGR